MDLRLVNQQTNYEEFKNTVREDVWPNVSHCKSKLNTHTSNVLCYLIAKQV